MPWMRPSANPSNCTFADCLRSTRHHRFENLTRVGLSPILALGNDAVVFVSAANVRFPANAAEVRDSVEPRAQAIGARDGWILRVGSSLETPCLDNRLTPEHDKALRERG
jgi:hypothetical protein